jgi:hypothetical protein
MASLLIILANLGEFQLRPQNDVYTGRHLKVIQRRKKATRSTLQARKDYNRAIREQDIGL